MPVPLFQSELKLAGLNSGYTLELLRRYAREQERLPEGIEKVLAGNSQSDKYKRADSFLKALVTRLNEGIIDLEP